MSVTGEPVKFPGNPSETPMSRLINFYRDTLTTLVLLVRDFAKNP